jgi:hypothetical protein
MCIKLLLTEHVRFHTCLFRVACMLSTPVLSSSVKLKCKKNESNDASGLPRLTV